MSYDTLKGDLDSFQKRIRERWDDFNELEIDEIGHSTDRLRLALEQKFGLSPDEAARQVDDFLRHTPKE